MWTLLLIVLAVFATGLLLRGFDSRRMPDLKVWHRPLKGCEFRARSAGEVRDLGAYLELEAQLFDRVDRDVYGHIGAEDRLNFNRYHADSQSDPRRHTPNWNRTFELEPGGGSARGAALVLHGLTDSPYSVRALGELLARQGFYVLGLRVPGHGACPGELTTVSRRDWQAAAHLAARHVASRAGDGAFVVAGYSTGGALALDLSLDALDDDGLRRPDRLFLFSPAVGVSGFARLADWHKLISWVPYFEKLKWASIDPEFDPYKFNSFPKNAGDQVFKLTQEIKRRLKRLAAAGRSGELPPMLTFQSIVDATIVVEDLLEDLYARLGSTASELVLFDVNRWSHFRDFLKRPDRLQADLEGQGELPYRLTLVTNTADDRLDVTARSRGPGTAAATDEPLGLAWPQQVYSLSHVAVTFPPDDPIYGAAPLPGEERPYHLGSLAPRGERDLLRVGVGQIMRLRHNPFFAYVERRIGEVLAAPRG